MSRNTPHNTAMMTARTKGDLLLQHWDALDEKERREMAEAVVFAHRELMEFRNIINAMARLDAPASEAAQEVIDF